MDLDTIEQLLQCYTLEEILEENELTEADLLYLLVENKLITLPDMKPL